MKSSGTKRTSDVPEKRDDEMNNWDFEGMMTAEERVSSVIGGKSREVQHVCEDGVEVVTTTIIEVFELSREGIKGKRKTATVSGRQTDLEAKLV